MKPFFLLLLLIASGLLVALVSRPIDLFAAVTQRLGHGAELLKTKRQLTSRTLKAVEHSLPGDGWRPAAQF